MKTKDITTATALLSDAKLTGMADTDKFTVIRALRVLKPIRQQYEDFVRDASERLKPEGFDQLQERARKWNDQHKGKKMADLTDDERTRRSLRQAAGRQRGLDGRNHPAADGRVNEERDLGVRYK